MMCTYHHYNDNDDVHDEEEVVDTDKDTDEDDDDDNNTDEDDDETNGHLQNVLVHWQCIHGVHARDDDVDDDTDDGADTDADKEDVDINTDGNDDVCNTDEWSICMYWFNSFSSSECNEWRRDDETDGEMERWVGDAGNRGEIDGEIHGIWLGIHEECIVDVFCMSRWELNVLSTLSHACSTSSRWTGTCSMFVRGCVGKFNEFNVEETTTSPLILTWEFMVNKSFLAEFSPLSHGIHGFKQGIEDDGVINVWTTGLIIDFCCFDVICL